MDTLDCIKERRSIRKFKNQAVSPETLEQLVSAASYSPSWKNSQIARYTMVKTAQIKNKIADEMVSPFNKETINSAPILVVISYVKNRCGFEKDGSFSTSKGAAWQMFDCGIAAQTFCLAAKDMGLGTVIMGLFDENKISEYLNIPDNQEIGCLIALGYPDENPEMPKRKSVNELISYK